MVELQPSKLIVWVRFPSSAPKSKAPNGCLIFLVKRIRNRRRALRKQSGGLFLARAQMTLCRCSRPGKRRRWGPLKLTHIIRSKKQGAQRVPFLFGQADWESKASVKKTVRRTVFSESADDTMSLLTPRKAAQVAALNLTHIIRSKKGHPREALRKEVVSLGLL